jgi:Leucine-rich repeat (LRR) protein
VLITSLRECGSLHACTLRTKPIDRSSGELCLPLRSRELRSTDKQHCCEFTARVHVIVPLPCPRTGMACPYWVQSGVANVFLLVSTVMSAAPTHADGAPSPAPLAAPSVAPSSPAAGFAALNSADQTALSEIGASGAFGLAFNTSCVGWDGPSACQGPCLGCGGAADNTSRVVALNLSSFGITAAVPWLNGVCALSALQLLDLSGNQLVGGVSACVGNLTALTRLSLGKTMYFNSGVFPFEAVCNMRGLQYLSLYFGQFTGPISECIAGMTALTYLNLGHCQFTGNSSLVFASLSNLTSLEYLDLTYNSIGGSYTPFITGLTRLTYLDLSHMTIGLSGEMPWETLCTMTRLQYLNLSMYGSAHHPDPTPISPCIGGLTQLVSFNLGYTYSAGVAPWASICNMTNLVSLDLNTAGLEGPIEPCISSMRVLNNMDLGQNSLTGEVPWDALCRMSALQQIGLDSNNLVGAISPCIGALSNLVYLNLCDNSFEGEMPWSAVCNLTSLQHLSMYSNALNGIISPCLASLPLLSQVDLATNRFTGEVPWSALCTLTNLNYLGIGSNMLTGVISSCIGDLRMLTHIDVSDNQLVGAPPWEAMCVLGGGLQYLALASNQLIGMIAPCIGQLSGLTNLTLGGNLFGGPLVPTTMCQLANLQGLFIQNSPRLNGSLPTCMGNMTSLKQVDMSNVPGLIGPLPPELFTLPKLVYFIVTGASFEGGFPQSNTPQEIGLTANAWLPSLQLLALVSCGLSGEIPSWMGQLPAAEVRTLHCDHAL